MIYRRSTIGAGLLVGAFLAACASWPVDRLYMHWKDNRESFTFRF